MTAIKVNKAQKIKGSPKIPADKSISHRALIIGSLTNGKTSIKNLLEADDVLSTLNCLKSLGVQIDKSNGDYIVYGVGNYGYKKSEKPLNVGNSGTTLRILPGILAAQDFETELIGDASVSSRPMERVLKPLCKMGARAVSVNGHAPIKIEGNKLKGIKYTTDVPSAQVKSAILLSGLLAKGKTVITEDYKSRDHTEKMLAHFGAEMDIKENCVSIKGGQQLKANDIDIPADFSSAAYFIAAALLVPGSEINLTDVGINPTRIGMARVLKRMGYDLFADAQTTQACGEEKANLTIKKSSLKATEIEKDEIPSLIDELPIIAVLATQAKGKTIINGAEELRVKETDRISALVSELNKMGGEVEEKEDGLIIEGPKTLHGATVDSFGDHRLAMALSIAAVIAEGATVIEEAGVIGVSFPSFYDTLKTLSVSVEKEM